MTTRTGFTWLLLLWMGLAVFAPAAFGKLIYVDADAPGADTGTSWTDAYIDLQDALAAARSGDEIRVAQGTYRPDRGRAVRRRDRMASFELKSRVTLRGGYAGAAYPNPDARNIHVYRTILSGDLAGDDRPPTNIWDLASDPRREDNSIHVVTAGRIIRAVLDGFYIVGGHADVPGGTQYSRGGGVYLAQNAEVSLVQCTFMHNYAHMGGAVCSFGGAPLLVDCDFRENLAEFGGALAVRMGPATAIGCSFRQNAALADGGALWSDISQGTYLNCTFSANTALDSGGAVNAQLSFLEITNGLFCGNAAACSGGAINLGTCRHRNGTGGSQITLMNCTLADNRAREGKAIQCFNDPVADFGPSTIRVGNCILRNGGDEIRNNDYSKVDVTFSNVEGGHEGVNNVDVDPMFAAKGQWSGPAEPGDVIGTGWIEGDYRLLADSPCIDVGFGQYVPLDRMDLDGDGNTSEVIPVDIRNRPRVAAKPGVAAASGRPPEPRVDRGAYEYQNSQTVFRFWSPVYGKHFYTISELERGRLIRNHSHIWTYEEGAGYEAFRDGSNPDTAPVYRFWSPINNMHFYTIDEDEKDRVIENYPHAWVYEGVVFHAHPEGRRPGLAKPVYRFWSPALGGHFYTIDESERTVLIEEFGHSWIEEGIAWYAYPIPEEP